MGAGVAIIGGGALLEMSAQSSYSDYDHQVAECNMNNQGCPTTSALTDLKSSGDSKKLFGYVGYGVGAATVLVGVGLAYLNRPQGYQIRAEDIDNQRVSVSPVVAPGYTGAAVQGHF
jgi:hypothetical protein